MTKTKTPGFPRRRVALRGEQARREGAPAYDAAEDHTVVYRAGDQLGAWSYGLLSFLGLGMTAIAWLAVPISGAWLLNGWWLGRRQTAPARARKPDSTCVS